MREAEDGQPPLSDADGDPVMHVALPLQELFWGDYYGSLTDRFGVRWMFNCAASARSAVSGSPPTAQS